jgi:HAMP domain-containing protein
MIQKKLKFKILAGFMLLVAMLALAGAISIIEFIKLSSSFTAIIDDNYKSIEASRKMLLALEREDSGYLLQLLGQANDGKKTIFAADTSFENAFSIAKNNITEKDENVYIGSIQKAYENYKQLLYRPVMDSVNLSKIDVYNYEVHKSFLEVKHQVENLMALNQKSMHQQSSILIEKSHRAIMPGIVAICASLIFALLLSYFISKYFVKPIIMLSEAIAKYKPGIQIFDFNIQTRDEIKTLEQEIIYLIDRINNHKNAGL